MKGRYKSEDQLGDEQHDEQGYKTIEEIAARAVEIGYVSVPVVPVEDG